IAMKRTYFTTPLMILTLMVSTLTFSGCFVETCDVCPGDPPPCSYGPDGVPGPAFFGLDWAAATPDYVWTNNQAIPQVFKYGTYYNSLPGSFQLYYEGAVMDGCCLVEYYWEVDFQVWINGGTTGGCGYAGIDGLPSYLMMQMGPNGPGEIRTNKMAKDGVTMEIVQDLPEEKVLLFTKGDINVKMTYKKLSASKKAELDPSGEITAETSGKTALK
ncbi:MAG: hypothetical protein AAF570_10500, partial [Bacteroidota bacterium]